MGILLYFKMAIDCTAASNESIPDANNYRPLSLNPLDYSGGKCFSEGEGLYMMNGLAAGCCIAFGFVGLVGAAVRWYLDKNYLRRYALVRWRKGGGDEEGRKGGEVWRGCGEVCLFIYVCVIGYKQNCFKNTIIYALSHNVFFLFARIELDVKLLLRSFFIKSIAGSGFPQMASAPASKKPTLGLEHVPGLLSSPVNPIRTPSKPCFFLNISTTSTPFSAPPALSILLSMTTMSISCSCITSRASSPVAEEEKEAKEEEQETEEEQEKEAELEKTNAFEWERETEII
jgi:hypothetical protein